MFGFWGFNIRYLFVHRCNVSVSRCLIVHSIAVNMYVLLPWTAMIVEFCVRAAAGQQIMSIAVFVVLASLELALIVLFSIACVLRWRCYWVFLTELLLLAFSNVFFIMFMFIEVSVSQV